MPSTVGAATFSSGLELAAGYRRWLAELFRPYLGKTILEVGIGDGGYFSLFRTQGRYVGLELDEDLIDRARRRNPEAEYLQGDVADRSTVERLRAMGIDTILCFNVLEHLEDDREAVRNMIEVLEPRGRLLLLVPAHAALFTDLDRLAGHLRRYTTRQVAEILPASAKVERLQFFNPLGGVGWWANRFIRHRDLEGSRVRWQILVFDRLLLPLSRWLTPLTRGFFGQSVVCVARKS